jgi:hypothetical protein
LILIVYEFEGIFDALHFPCPSTLFVGFWDDEISLWATTLPRWLSNAFLPCLCPSYALLRLGRPRPC